LLRLTIVKVGYGGAGRTVALAVTLQPSGSEAVTVTIIGGVDPVGIWYCPVVVEELRLKGVGDHMREEGFAADPDGVTCTMANVLPQVACKAEATSRGAGVMVLCTMRVIGTQAPCGCINKV